jgi:hypothetical protein
VAFQLGLGALQGAATLVVLRRLPYSFVPLCAGLSLLVDTRWESTDDGLYHQL